MREATEITTEYRVQTISEAQSHKKPLKWTHNSFTQLKC